MRQSMEEGACPSQNTTLQKLWLLSHLESLQILSFETSPFRHNFGLRGENSLRPIEDLSFMFFLVSHSFFQIEIGLC